MSAAWDRLQPALRRLPDVRAVVVGVVVGVISALAGLDVLDAALVGLAVTAIGLVVLALDGGEAYVWPVEDQEQTDGTRREISSLTWSFVGRDGRVSENAVKHLQQVATVRLARHGVVVPGGLRALPKLLERAAEQSAVLRNDGSPDPAAVAWERDLRTAATRAEEMLGARAWRTLGHAGHLPSLADVAHCVDVLEDLDPTTSARPAPVPAPAPESTS